MDVSAQQPTPQPRNIPRPGLPGYDDDDLVEMDVIEQAHKIGGRTGRNWRRSPGGLPHMVVGRSVLVRVGTYRKWLLSREVAPGAWRQEPQAASQEPQAAISLCQCSTVDRAGDGA